MLVYGAINKYFQGHSSLADLMFGLRQRDTGLTKYPVNNRQRTVTYSVTVVLRQPKPQFLAGLKQHLTGLYSPQEITNSNATSLPVHIHFPTHVNGAEYIPYCVTILLLFLYVYYMGALVVLYNFNHHFDSKTNYENLAFINPNFLEGNTNKSQA